MNKSEVEDALAQVLSRAYSYELMVEVIDPAPCESRENGAWKILQCEQLLRQALFGRGDGAF